MKYYGANKATEFTRKQINVIFAKAKRGELKVEKWFIGTLYDLAEYYGYDSNGSVAEKESSILNILESVFSGNIKKAQEDINFLTNKIYNSYGRKMQAGIDRSVFIA